MYYKKEQDTKIIDVVKNVKGVSNPHKLMTKKIGSQYTIGLHVEVDPILTVLEVHEIGKNVKKEIKNLFSEDTVIYLHIDPKK